MKPGNLLIQGAKSGGQTKDEGSYCKTFRIFGTSFFAANVLYPELLERNWREQKGIERLWKKDSLLQNV